MVEVIGSVYKIEKYKLNDKDLFISYLIDKNFIYTTLYTYDNYTDVISRCLDEEVVIEKTRKFLIERGVKIGTRYEYRTIGND